MQTLGNEPFVFCHNIDNCYFIMEHDNFGIPGKQECECQCESEWCSVKCSFGCATDRQQKPAPGGSQEYFVTGVQQTTRGLIDLYNLSNFCPRRYSNANVKVPQHLTFPFVRNRIATHETPKQKRNRLNSSTRLL